MWVQVPPPPPFKEKRKMLTKSQKKYTEEFEKYKDMIIQPGFYIGVHAPVGTVLSTIIEYEVLSVGLDEAVLKTVKSGHVTTKTLHWCRKNLMEIKR
jgi:hypothetical protein